MYLVGVAGGSGSGKTTFTRRIIDAVASSSLGVLHQDHYYLDGDQPNFDHPAAFDWGLLRQHLSVLKSGGTVAVPHYDYARNRRTRETTVLGPCGAVVLEGIFALWKPEIRELFDLTIYLNVEADIRFIRRLHRDIRERGRTVDGIIRQYYDTVRPMHHEFLEPTRQYAHLIVGDETEVAAEAVAARIAAALRGRKA